jgi:hypothetical protein
MFTDVPWTERPGVHLGDNCPSRQIFDGRHMHQLDNIRSSYFLVEIDRSCTVNRMFIGPNLDIVLDDRNW